jgi:hypothetical protein
MRGMNLGMLTIGAKASLIGLKMNIIFSSLTLAPVPTQGFAQRGEGIGVRALQVYTWIKQYAKL